MIRYTMLNKVQPHALRMKKPSSDIHLAIAYSFMLNARTGYASAVVLVTRYVRS